MPFPIKSTKIVNFSQTHAKAVYFSVLTTLKHCVKSIRKKHEKRWKLKLEELSYRAIQSFVRSVLWLYGVSGSNWCLKKFKYPKLILLFHEKRRRCSQQVSNFEPLGITFCKNEMIQGCKGIFFKRFFLELVKLWTLFAVVMYHTHDISRQTTKFLQR